MHKRDTREKKIAKGSMFSMEVLIPDGMAGCSFFSTSVTSPFVNTEVVT